MRALTGMDKAITNKRCQMLKTNRILDPGEARHFQPFHHAPVRLALFCEPARPHQTGTTSVTDAGKSPRPAAPRKPRLLWASAYCLLDTCSGTSMATREMLRQRVAHGYEV